PIRALEGARRSSPASAVVALALPQMRDRPALEQVELASGDRPFDISRVAVDLLASMGEPAELVDLIVVEAEPFDELRCDLLLDRAAARNAAHRDALQSRLPLEDLPPPAAPEVLRHHHAPPAPLPAP